MHPFEEALAPGRRFQRLLHYLPLPERGI